MRLAVIIPAFNEEKTVGQVVRSILRGLPGIRWTKIVVVDDGSADKTREIALSAGADEVISHSRNLGLGVAFRSGIRTALKMGADVAVTIDGDGQFDVGDIPRLLEPIIKEEADVVTGSRFLNGRPRMPAIKFVGNRLFTGIVSRAVGHPLTDTQCGFRAYSRRAMANLVTFGTFTYTQEALLALVEKGMRVREVRVQVRQRQVGKSRVVRRWYLYGVKSLLIILGFLRDNRPQVFFGALGLALLAPLMLSLAALLALWAITGQVSQLSLPLALLIVAFGLGGLMLVGALLADMLVRSRRVQEETLSLLWDLVKESQSTPNPQSSNGSNLETDKEANAPAAKQS